MKEVETPLVSTTFVISQVYGGGGATTGTPTYTLDYIELKNVSATAQFLNGMALQYGAATGQFGGSTGTNIVALPNRLIAPGQYYLIALGTTGTVGAPLPVPADFSSTTINMSGTSGKIALTTTTTWLNCGGVAPGTACVFPNANFVDWVAYGAAGNVTAGNGEGGTSVNNGVALTNVQGGVRKTAGCTDTDNNNSDFDVLSPPIPGSAASTRTPCVPTTFLSRAPSDFNGDGRTDYGVVRTTAANGGTQARWFIAYNGANITNQTVDWGLVTTDTNTPGDFDGDGKDDIAVWRRETGASGFYIINSGDLTFRFARFGLPEDDPSVVADYDGDGRDDPAIYRDGINPGDQSYFWWMPSAAPIAGQQVPVRWGISGDTPSPGDYDGDGRADFMVQRNENGFGNFYYHQGSGGYDAPGGIETASFFGLSSDLVTPGDFDGDGKTDLCVVRSEGTQWVWYYRSSQTGATVGGVAWGLSTSVPGVSVRDALIQGDYDGDGRTDYATWREFTDSDPITFPNSVFFVLTTTGRVSAVTYGQEFDVPIARDNVH